MSNSKMILGALECGGRLYPTALIVVTRNGWLKRRLQQRWGGSVEPGRWVLKSRKQRIELLRNWADETPCRENELRAELYRLMAEQKSDI